MTRSPAMGRSKSSYGTGPTYPSSVEVSPAAFLSTMADTMAPLPSPSTLHGTSHGTRGFKWPAVSRDNEVHASHLSSDI